MKQDSIQTGLCNEEKNMADSGRIEKKRDRQTNQADMGQKRRSHRMNITALLIFLFLFIGCSLLQYANNGQNAQKSCGLMLDQMKELITENERSFQQLEDTLNILFGRISRRIILHMAGRITRRQMILLRWRSC